MVIDLDKELRKIRRAIGLRSLFPKTSVAEQFRAFCEIMWVGLSSFRKHKKGLRFLSSQPSETSVLHILLQRSASAEPSNKSCADTAKHNCLFLPVP